MNKSFLIALVCLGLSLSARNVSAQAVQISTQMSASAATQGSGIATPTTYYHQLMWSLSGPAPTACTVELDTAPDDSTWTTGGAIPAQTCTSGGQSALFNSASADVRINLSTFTGTGTIHISYVGYSSGPAGVVMSGAAAPTGTCTGGALYTITGTGALYSCDNGTWAAISGGSIAFPSTVSGAVNSGGIPCFNSSTQESSSTAITANDVIVGGGAGACVSDSGVLYTNLAQLTLGSTQTIQCTGNINCLIVKQSSGGGIPLLVEGLSGSILFEVAPGATAANVFTGSVAIDNLYSQGVTHLLYSHTAPTIAGAGCGGSAASITSNNGTAAFKVNVGTSNTGTCTITLPTAATDWVCFADDTTTTSASVFITKVIPTSGHLTTEVTLQNYTDAAATGDWTDSDILEGSCHGE
jgi:hypothetical protein